MNRSRIIFGLLIIAVVAGSLGWIKVFGPHRPYLDWKSGDLAQYLLDRGRNHEECWDLVVTGIFGPTPGSRRALCIFEFAQRSLDPSVCATLLPNEYGLACLSEVGGKIATGKPCSGSWGKNEVYCNPTYSEGELLIENPQIENCKAYQRTDVREWCLKTRTWRLGANECSTISNTVVRNECEEGYAFSQKNTELCQVITNDAWRVYCEIRINAWLKYPHLRDSFYFGSQNSSNSESSK